MRQELLTDLVYEYFVMRFRFEYYQNGDTLPSIEKLRQEFCVSSDTVKAALKRLREEGFIITQSRKRTKVSFSQSKEEHDEYIAAFLADRCCALPDLAESARLLLGPMMTEGICRMQEDDIPALLKLVERMGVDEYSLFFCSVMQKLNNPLAMNLFWEIALFQGISMMFQENNLHAAAPDAVRQILRETLLAGQQRDRERVPKRFGAFAEEAFQVPRQDERRSPPEVEPENQLSFVWRIYWERPQICYNLAMWILHQMVMGEYRGKQFLPSYQKLAESLQVSVITVRRTIGLLHRLGAVKPMNGKGCRILRDGSSTEEVQFGDQDIRRSLAQFLQAYEILAYTCEEVTRETFPRFPEEAIEELIGRLKEYWEEGNCERVLLCYLLQVRRYCPLMAIREVYGKIYGFFLWGYPIKLCSEDGSRFEYRSMRFTMEIVRALEKRDYEGFAKVLGDFVSHEVGCLERSLLQVGLKPEELHPASSIRLMLT